MLRAPWLPHRIGAYANVARNVHGEITAFDTVELPAKIELQPVELIEAGARTLRDGVKAFIAADPLGRVQLGVGLVFAWQGTVYTVIQVGKSVADPYGGFQGMTCFAVHKRGD